MLLLIMLPAQLNQQCCRSCQSHFVGVGMTAVVAVGRVRLIVSCMFWTSQVPMSFAVIVKLIVVDLKYIIMTINNTQYMAYGSSY